MGRAGPMGQLIMDFTGPVLGWAWSTWARAGLGRELVSPWRTLMPTHIYSARKVTWHGCHDSEKHASNLQRVPDTKMQGHGLRHAVGCHDVPTLLWVWRQQSKGATIPSLGARLPLDFLRGAKCQVPAKGRNLLCCDHRRGNVSEQGGGAPLVAVM